MENLSRKNKQWVWNAQYKAVEEIRKVILSPILLEHFDPSKTLVVSAGACSTGIGGIILQRDQHDHERAVYHMSQSLTYTQRNYSQLEKEALALIIALDRSFP